MPDYSTSEPAPEICVRQWINSPEPITLKGMRGRPVLIHAFQMLCPACVAHGLPQTEKAFQLFRETDLAVIGLHTVVEHHEAMSPLALEAFVHEYRLSFPIGIDMPGRGTPIPETMKRYQTRGTPKTILVGRDGRLITHEFGQIDDLALGAMIASVLNHGIHRASAKSDPEPMSEETSHCDTGGCVASQFDKNSNR